MTFAEFLESSLFFEFINNNNNNNKIFVNLKLKKEFFCFKLH